MLQAAELSVKSIPFFCGLASLKIHRSHKLQGFNSTHAGWGQHARAQHKGFVAASWLPKILDCRPAWCSEPTESCSTISLLHACTEDLYRFSLECFVALLGGHPASARRFAIQERTSREMDSSLVECSWV